jgi:hypothetical protein
MALCINVLGQKKRKKLIYSFLCGNAKIEGRHDDLSIFFAGICQLSTV